MDMTADIGCQSAPSFRESLHLLEVPFPDPANVVPIDIAVDELNVHPAVGDPIPRDS